MRVVKAAVDISITSPAQFSSLEILLAGDTVFAFHFCDCFYQLGLISGIHFSLVLRATCFGCRTAGIFVLDNPAQVHQES